MANSQGNKQNLKSYPPQWYSQPTQTIRVPVILADAILEIAHKLDDTLSQVDTSKGGDLHYSISGQLEGLEEPLPY